MGTSGDRKGYKVFSINTTVRNPKRNTEFLKLFKKYHGEIFDKEKSYQYFFDLVKKGVYRLTNISEAVKMKIENDEELSSSEVATAIKQNPQATGLVGRVMTQLRSMKDQGFLMFEPIKRGLKKIYITKLGNDLIENNIDATLIYTKAMMGMHANSPIRVTMLNQSRPFLNTIFTINEVNKRWVLLGNEPKGILYHEFSTFVLSMKDCDYMKSANEIIKYRLKNKFKIKINELKDYLVENNILPIADDSFLKDYPDDVYRKFEMTGLLTKHGAFNYIYINFSKYNIQKIESILEDYKNYKFEHFSSVKEYYDYINNIEIPWQKDEIIRQKIIESKSQILQIQLDKSLTLSQQEEFLDRIFYSKALENAVHKFNFKIINRELLILSGLVKEKSKFDEISEPLRLEYLLALLFGKKYGLLGLVSNIIYSEDGSPLHFAPASKCDMMYHNAEGSFILEPTMQRGKNQLLNNETTNIVRHIKDETRKNGLNYRAMMIAPYVHPDIVEFFSYQADHNVVNIAPLNINRFVTLIFDSDNIKLLCQNFDTIVTDLIKMDSSKFSDLINNHIVSENIYK